MGKLRIIEVEWLDAHRKDGWSNNHEIDTWDDRDGFVKQIGYLYKETKDWLYMVSGHGNEKPDDPGYLCTHKIPQGMIKKKRYLK